MMNAKTGGRSARFLWRCHDCKKQFTVRVGTVYEESRIPLRHWCYAFWRASTSKKGVSALEIKRQCQMSYKSALFLMHRIRFAMAPDHATAPKLTGTVEADETHIGGKPRHRAARKRNFRILAGKALHDFIYAQVGYDPANLVPEIWRQFHDRVSLTYNSVPSGYFSVFKETSDIIVHLGQNGLPIDSKFVPDISVGQHWSKHWTANDLEAKYGDRVKFQHNYPSYFPQAASNPQEPWCYPEMALGDFKRWIREDYIKGGKFKKYLSDQESKRALPPSFAQLAIAAYIDSDTPKKLS
jgi:hypothetical protein